MNLCFYVWYVSGFEVGMNLCACMDIFPIWYISLLSLYVLYMVYVLCLLFSSSSTHLPIRLEVGGNLDGWRETVCAYTFITLYSWYA